jgi:hypothetical protein
VVVLVALGHLVVATLWFGSMAYSLGVVQPRLRRLFGDPARVEEVYRELAAGNRWRVVALIVVLGATGLGLVALADTRERWWWAVIAAKAALLLAASGLFWWVSWRGWPARIFALPAELPALQARFRLVALGMAVLVGTAFVLGAIAAHAGSP